ncbi:MAG: response regulator [Deltaproteobacteria bacterium]|nr:MAG: response regulator [Deltaproteobacteria bacterium]
MANVKSGEKGKGLRGSLRDISLLEVIKPICKSKAKAALFLKLGKEEGELFFDGGRLIQANSTSLQGKEAAYNLIAWRNGEFHLTKGKEPRLKNVDIEWEDFQRFYREEIEKVVLGLIPVIHMELFFELRNEKNELLYRFCNSEEINNQVDLFDSFYKKKIEEIQTELKSGDEKTYVKATKNFVLLVKYLTELRYFVNAIFTESEKIDSFRNWLEDVFEPKVLDSVSAALQRADKRDIRGTILVIDDSPTILAILENTLSEYHFRVITAEDGYEGMVKINDERPDLIFLDVMMPKMDGYEVCRRIKKDKELSKIPVVMLTSKELVDDDGTAFREGADMYVQKPFTPKKILTIVENLLGIG